MIISVTMNPAIDKTAYVDALHVGGLNRLDQVESSAGGKGINVSKTIQQLGGESIASGFLAGSNGRYIQQCLQALQIQQNMVFVGGETRVNLKVVDKSKELTELNEVGPTIQEKDMQTLMDTLLSIANENDIVVLSGSVPMGVAKDMYATLTSLLKQKGIHVILDADGPLFEEGVKAIPHVIKPNKYELCKYFNKDGNISDQEVIGLARRFLTQGVQLVVVSMGGEGALFMSGDEAYKVQALPIDVLSSVGAGDAMVAAIAYAMDKKLTVEETIVLAVATSAGACESKGTNPAPLSRVKQLMKQVKIQKVEGV